MCVGREVVVGFIDREEERVGVGLNPRGGGGGGDDGGREGGG